ncbi:unnamed protein product [Paramecium primaurelia]|uniref:folate gamma-glutamyl hydrolase n=1 Tax=Paramecium primaurelia TaxID=5886 RepID=A0A8S1PQE4_PARPR|nr:unnamed protein product [Paramecium primaurelia]
MPRILLLLSCLLFLSQSNFIDDIEYLTEINNNVVIGIFTQPSDPDYIDYPSSQYSYLAASYVKFVEMAGARVVPIPYEADNTILEKYFQGINGIIIPGGASELDTPTGPSKFTKAVAYMLNRALQMNEAGEVFPVLGICMGFQTLHYIISGYKTPFLYRVYGENGISHSLENGDRNFSLYKDFDDDTYQAMQTNQYLYYSHNWGVSPDLYKKYPSLDAFFRITGTNQDIKGQTFIASMQGKQYPVYGVQYHPEKNIFEWKVSAPHSYLAVKVSANHIDAFVNQARLNNHQFNAEQLNKAVIYNFKTVQEKNASFVQVYFFKNGELSL